MAEKTTAIRRLRWSYWAYMAATGIGIAGTWSSVVDIARTQVPAAWVELALSVVVMCGAGFLTGMAAQRLTAALYAQVPPEPTSMDDLMGYEDEVAHYWRDED